MPSDEDYEAMEEGNCRGREKRLQQRINQIESSRGRPFEAKQNWHQRRRERMLDLHRIITGR